jgi:nicotinamide-nucleotide amidase
MREYDTEILSVGTELLLGHITNTDARDISEMLSKIGVNVRWHTVVGDNPERLAECVAIAKRRADVIITTGGLGPTCDDLTKQVLAKSFGLPLVENAAEREGLYEYIRLGKRYTPNNLSQALLPEGCTVFHNRWGTAPGCAFEAEGKIVLMLPGPPNECVPMFREYAIPYLKKLSEEQIVSHAIRIFGIGESAVDDLFAEEMMAPVIRHVKERLGDFVYGMDVESIEEAVLPLLKERGLSFAAAESCTGGEIAKRITDIPGASAVFAGGCVTYTNEVKARLLGIDRELIERNGAVSEPVARLMAERVRAVTGADLGVGVTGLAGPDGDGVHEVGTVFVSLAAQGETFVRELHLGTFRTRSFIRRMAGNHVYDMLRRWLTGLPVCPQG